MSDLISRQMAIDAIKSLFFNVPYSEKNIAWSMALTKIRQLPSVTPQLKMGKWIESKGYDDRDHFYICSECGRYINLNCGAKLSDYPYCHCGAKMEVSE